MHACDTLNKSGYSLGNIDITIILEEPRLQNFIPQMRKNISTLTSLDIDRISIKSSTSQGIGLIEIIKQLHVIPQFLSRNENSH